jgi:polyhydroxyalkanoate synthesis regulator phasin
MTTVPSQTTPVDEPVKRTLFYEMSRKILLASIGAAAVASDEIHSFIARMAERGELAEKEARALIKEVLEEREKLEKEQKTTTTPAQAQPDTAAEIDALQARVAELNRRIEELKKAPPAQ